MVSFWVMSGVLGLVGVVLVILGLVGRQKFSYMQTWPRTEAVISSHEIHEDWGTKGMSDTKVKTYIPAAIFRFNGDLNA